MDGMFEEYSSRKATAMSSPLNIDVVRSPDEDAPPPYSAIADDSNSFLLPATGRRNASRFYEICATAPEPEHFISGAQYFLSNPAPSSHTCSAATVTSPPGEEQISVHTLTIFAKSQSKDFRRVPKCWRTGFKISSGDWKAFIEHVFPVHLAPAAAQDQLPRHVRAQIARDRKDCPQEGEQERGIRMAAVVAEWNAMFFQPRGKKIELHYVTSAGPTPSTDICPRCYPSSSRVIASRRKEATRTSTTSRSRSRSRASARDSVGENEAKSSRSEGINHTAEPASNTPPSPPPDAGQVSASLRGLFRDFASLIAGQAQHCSQRTKEQAIVQGRWFEEQAHAYGQLMERRRQESNQKRSRFFDDMRDKCQSSRSSQPHVARCGFQSEGMAEPRRSLGSRSLSSNMSSMTNLHYPSQGRNSFDSVMLENRLRSLSVDEKREEEAEEENFEHARSLSQMQEDLEQLKHEYKQLRRGVHEHAQNGASGQALGEAFSIQQQRLANIAFNYKDLKRKVPREKTLSRHCIRDGRKGRLSCPDATDCRCFHDRQSVD